MALLGSTSDRDDSRNTAGNGNASKFRNKGSRGGNNNTGPQQRTRQNNNNNKNNIRSNKNEITQEINKVDSNVTKNEVMSPEVRYPSNSVQNGSSGDWKQDLGDYKSVTGTLPTDSTEDVLVSLQKISTKILESSNSVLVNPTVVLTIYIPTIAVGVVIGRKGQTVGQLQKIAAEKSFATHPVRVSVVGREQLSSGIHSNEANAASMGMSSSNSGLLSTYDFKSVCSPNTSSGMHIFGTTPLSSVPYTHTELDMSNPGLTPVVIRAEPAAALLAASLLQDMVFKQYNVAAAPSTKMDKGLKQQHKQFETFEANDVDEVYCYDDDVIVDVPLSRHKHASIVGKRGVFLATVSADYAVRIMVPPPPMSVSNSTNSNSEKLDIIQLEGPLPNINHCLLKILQLASGSYINTKSNLTTNVVAGTRWEDKSITNIQNNKKPNRQQVNAVNGESTRNSSNLSNSPASHSHSIVLTAPITQAKMRSIGRKTDTTIKKKKKVDDGCLYTITSTLNSQSVSPSNVLSMQQQRTVVENNVNAAVALLQKWNSDNMTNASTGCVNPSSDSSSNGPPMSPRRPRNNVNQSTIAGKLPTGGRGGGGPHKASSNGVNNNRRGKAKPQSSVSKDSK